MIKLNFVNRVYVPHHKVISPQLIERRASKVDYIDDGLDTLRIKPKNFIGTISEGQKYFTFPEYEGMPTWFEKNFVHSISSLTSLVKKIDIHQFNTPNEDFLVIESPNLDIQKIKTYVNGRSVCYLEHRIPQKRLKHVPLEWRRDQFGAYTESVVVAGYEGCVIAGDTMVAVVLYHLRNKCRYQLMYVGNEIPNIPKTSL